MSGPTRTVWKTSDFASAYAFDVPIPKMFCMSLTLSTSG